MDDNIDFSQIIEQICEEKGIAKKDVIETIEAALAAAYRKDFGEKDQRVEAKFNEKTLQTKIYDVKEVVEEITEENKRQRGLILPKDAKKLKKGKKVKVGDIIKTEITPSAEYGRIAAQTAKQVIIQRIREAERTTIYEKYKDREGEVINGIVQRIELGNVYVDIGDISGVLYPREQLKRENYTIGQRLKVYIVEVKTTAKGPEIIISRTHPEMVRKLFELEVPEINSGTVEIKHVAREQGNRSKIAVSTNQEGVDPVGSCVGQRGTRVQTIIAELAGEKIDIIEWDENPVKFISNALSPAKVQKVDINEKTKEAKAYVNEDQLSLAIGKEGQNVRLAAKLTDWKIDIMKVEEDGPASPVKANEENDAPPQKTETPQDKKKKNPEKTDADNKKDKKKDSKKKEKSKKPNISKESKE